MKMKANYQIAVAIIAGLHWIYYGLIILGIMINAETWFFGTKINGDPALILHFSYGIFGFIVGYLIYLQKRIAYVLAIILFVFVIVSLRLQ